MVISGYVNYGVIGQEEENVFTISAPHLDASSYKEIIITLPEWIWVSVTDDDKLKVGWAEGEFLADDIISTDGKNPVFKFVDKQDHHATNKFEWEFVSI